MCFEKRQFFPVKTSFPNPMGFFKFPGFFPNPTDFFSPIFKTGFRSILIL
jgi:hypothetical protein